MFHNHSSVSAESQILMALLGATFPDQEETINQVQHVDQELVGLLINFYSNYCTKNNKDLTKYVVNSHEATTVMKNHMRGMEMCLHDLDQRRIFQTNVDTSWWHKLRLFTVKHQPILNAYMILFTIMANTLLIGMIVQILITSHKVAGLFPNKT